MNAREQKIKKLLLGFLLVLLMLPLVQQYVGLVHVQDLKGAQDPAVKPVFSKTNWLEGSFQDSFASWYNENFGFRNTLVRVRNQAGFSLYNVAFANGVIIGKDNYLYEENYIKAYTGEDFIGEKELKDKAMKLKAIQDSLAKKGVTLIVCLAAGKASYFPEYIPDEYGPAAAKTNYNVFARMLNEQNVNNIDFNKWFVDHKKTTPYPLFSKTGIHWSRYASMHVMDSLVKWVEWKRNVDMPGIVFGATTMSDSLQSPDDDIGEAMNLFCPIAAFRMGYQDFHYEDTTGKAKVKMMAISDSFFWELFDSYPTPAPFDSIEFYYYDRSIYHRDGSAPTVVDPDKAMEDVSKFNVVMIMGTEDNIVPLGWGFIDNAYDYFVLHKEVALEDRLTHSYEAAIRMDGGWLKAVRKKAIDAGIPLDSM
ncbi:MAG TPA: hypothetical protein VL651_03605, partial [Bacteroidia bacterium]|nr:hypothetical protein [Bacteroidia bacterium]